MKHALVLSLSTGLARPCSVLSFPVPREYQRIRDDLYGFLETARDKADVETTHRSYTMCQSVFQVFRRRLSARDAIRFAKTLPAGIRALFVADWEDVDIHDTARGLDFSSRQELTKEVKRLRANHNFAPDTAIADVAYSLRRYVDEAKFDQVLDELGEEAQEFWKV